MTYLTGIYSGKLVDPLNLSSSDIDIEDIAHSLALQCRYGGHVKFHYSVAQHSVILSYNVPKWLAFPALMHSGRRYSVAWERRHWDHQRVLSHLAG